MLGDRRSHRFAPYNDSPAKSHSQPWVEERQTRVAKGRLTPVLQCRCVFCLTHVLSTMAGKRTAGRESRHGTPEENFSSGNSVVIKKRAAKNFDLTRIDKGTVNFNRQMDRVFRKIPARGKRVHTNLSHTLLEDRE